MQVRIGWEPVDRCDWYLCVVGIGCMSAGNRIAGRHTC